MISVAVQKSVQWLHRSVQGLHGFLAVGKGVSNIAIGNGRRCPLRKGKEKREKRKVKNPNVNRKDIYE